ncbi:MAG TPA: hypothetical protein VH351_19665 [Bryobacteraceae bacterium]|nr:hypothetical protein [Bryobacteraceae bacterium]
MTGNGAEMLVRIAPQGRLDSGFSTLSDLASSVIQLKEMHHFYPVLISFRFEEAHYSVSFVTSTVLDCVSLIESATDAKEYAWLQSAGTLAELWSGSLLLLDMIEEVFGPANRKGPQQRAIESDVEQWRQHYLRSLDLFKRVGIKPAPDVEQGVSKYIELRTEWAHKINVLAQSMLYPPEKVDPSNAKEGSSGRILSFRSPPYTSPHQMFHSKEK